MKRLCFLFLIGLQLLGCEERTEIEPPVNLLDEATYIDVYIELHLFNAMVEAVDTVMYQDSLMTELFNKYSIAESDFRDSHAFYQSQTQLQQVRLDTATARLARALEALNEVRLLQPSQLDGNTQGSRQQD